MAIIIRLITILALLSLAQELDAAGLTREQAEIARSRILVEALSNAQAIKPTWDPKQRDCSGFVRYLYRSALARGSRIWLDRTNTPVDYVAAEDLVNFNFQSVGRDLDPDRIETGDILVYQDFEKKPEDRWHIMILLKSPRGSVSQILAAYHNGATGGKAQVRKVWLQDLLNVPGGEWRPSSLNPRFKGLYRWKGWSHL